MDKIHSNFFATAFCAAFLFVVSLGAFGQTITINDVTAVNDNEVLIGGTTTDIADGTLLYSYYGTINDEYSFSMGNTGETNGDSFQINVTALQPGTNYYFQVRDNTSGATSNIYEFQTTGTSGTTYTVTTDSAHTQYEIATLFGTVTPYSSGTIDKVGFIYATSSSMLEMMVQRITTENTVSESFVEGYVYDESRGLFKVQLNDLMSDADYYYQACVRSQENGEHWIVANSYESFRTEGNTSNSLMQSGDYNNHGYVDLGLSVKWATTNLGATNPEDYGNYYAWGETTPKSTYSWMTYQHCLEDEYLLTKYCFDMSYGADGYTDDLNTLVATDDAATATWGAGWRMPTRSEMDELRASCTWEWTTQNGIDGYIARNESTGYSMFLPAAGYLDESGEHSITYDGDYWTSSLSADNTVNAYSILFYDGTQQLSSDMERDYGLPIRAVYDATLATPRVTTKASDNVTETTAILQGSYNNDIEIPEAFSFGFLYGTDTTATLTEVSATYDDYTTYYIAEITGLSSGTTYYFKFFAENSNGRGYGQFWEFQTGGNIVNWITIGGGPGNNTNLPVNIYYKYSLSQQIYTPAEIGRAGTIERIAFYNNTDNIARTIDLYMFTSDRQSFTSTTDWETVSSSDRVFSGEVTFLSGEWTIIPLTTLFEYDGISNLIVVTDDNTAYDATTQRFLTFEASGQSIYVNGDDTDFDPTDLSSTTAIGLEDVKNQIKLGFTSTNPTFEYVDLGLPSGTKWATMNIGAERPEDFGTYFAWGETSPKTVYDWESYIYADGDSDSDPQLTKYCNDSGLGITDALTELETRDDAATAILGSNWRMPTYDEVIELRDYCEHVFTTQNGVAGTLVTGPNNQSIFIPAAAGRYYNNLILSEGTGTYWSSSLDTDDPTKAQGFFIESSGFGSITTPRYYGLPVRPVYAPSNTASNQTGSFTDTRDGRTYATVTIGNQEWMAENLRYDNSGSMLVALSGETSTTDPYLYYPNGESGNLETYGYLYNWPAAMNGESSSDANPSGVQGICPDGWHLPSNAEWVQLYQALGGETNAGAMLSGNASLWSNPTITESQYFGNSGFNALPAGYYESNDYGNFGNKAFFWSASEYDTESAYICYIGGEEVGNVGYGESAGLSVRCVKDAGNTANNNTNENSGDIIYQCDFENGSEDNWPQLVNGDQTNFWIVGLGSSDVSTTETNSLYITNDSASYSYNSGAESSVYAYKEITLPSRTNYHILFDWKCNGEGNYDFLRAFLIPTSENPDLSAGNSLGDGYESANSTPDGWIDISYGQMASSDNQWQQTDRTMALSGGNYYLVFYWHNDGSAGSNPPAAVDNIFFYKLKPISVTANNVTDKTSTSATLNGSITFIDEPENIAAGFKWGNSETSLLDNLTTQSSGETFSAQLTDLTPQTAYYYQAYAVYDGDTAFSEIAQFRTALDEDALGGANNPLTIGDINEWLDFTEALGSYTIGTTYKDVVLYDYGQDIYFSLESDLSFTDAGVTFSIQEFRGNLNGNNNTITIEPNQNITGIFSTISYGHIDNLNLRINSSVTLEDASMFGVLCQKSYEASISNCTVSGVSSDVVLTSNDYEKPVGGLVGYATQTTISGCTNNLKITSDVARVGGIAGKADGTIMYCTNNAELSGAYVGGIMAEGAATITNCLNTGRINCSDEYAGGISGSGGNISTCMNIGEISATGTKKAGGIVGNAESATVTNCANYGVFTSLSSPMGGIAGTGYGRGTYSDNVSAPIFRGDEAPSVDLNTEIYATVGGSTGDETDDFFDEQLGDIKVDSLRLRFIERGTRKTSNEMVGSALSTSLSSEYWDFTEGVYPKPKNITETPQTLAARIPIYLSTHEYYGRQQSVFGVWSDFMLPTTIDGQTVTWESSNTDRISISNGSATVNRPTSGDEIVTLTASYQGYSKWFTVTVIGPKQIPVNTDDAWQDSVISLNASFSDDLEGITYVYDYGFEYSTTSADLSEGVTQVHSNNFYYEQTIGFSYPLAGIPNGTMVYYRAYATTADGTEYGEIKSHKALGAPEVVAKYPMWRTDNSATIDLDITLNEGEYDEFYQFEKRNVYYGTERTNLTLIEYIDYEADYGRFYVYLSDLEPNTKYYYVAEVTNDYGTTRSDTLDFITCGTMTDSRDNTQYNTIQIGNQTWMAQNLKYVGNIPEGADTSSTVAYRYNPGNFSDVVDEYGYLYNWKATLNGGNSSAENPSGVQGICPPGWHLPSDAEWTQLTEYLGGGDDVPAMLSGQPSGEDQYWQTCDMTESVDFGKSGFNALPTGVYYADYYEYGRQTAFWSVTKSDDIHIYSRYIMGYGEGSISRSENEGPNGYAVRCIKGTAVYAYDTINPCMEQPYSYTYHDTVITTDGDYTIREQIDSDTENIYKLHIAFHPTLTATVSEFSNGCFGANNGYVEVSATGGAGTYTYNWNTPEAQTTARVNNLGAGEYAVTVTDAARCTATVSQTLTTPTEISASINGNNPNCYGDETALTANASGGTPDYTYNWSSGESDASIIVAPTTTTTYTVTITDANNCTATASKNIVVNSQLTVAISGDTQVQCFGDNTATLTATASGGSMAMGYTYTWSNSQSGQNITGVGAGTYSVTVTDGNGCTASANATVTGPTAALSASTTASSNASCNGASDGSATVTANGGTTDYTYLWSNNATTPAVSDLAAGNYSVTVTDANGCTATANATITEPTELTSELSAGTIACNGSTTNITNTVEGGIEPYQYYWSNSSNEQNLSGVSAGTYTVTVRDNNGCSVVESLEITQPNALTTSLSATSILCNGQTSNITNTVAGGTPNYTYNWNNGATTQNLEGVGGGTYSVTVTDANSCVATASVTVNEPEELTSELSAGTIACNGSTTDITNAVSGGTTPITYNWSNGANTQNLTGVVAGTYSVTVRDNNSCSVVREITITQPNVLAVSVDAGSVACNGETTNITSTVNGGTPNYSYAWSNGETTNNLTDVGAGTYSVTVSDANSCTASAITTVSEPDVLTVSISGSTSVCQNTTSTLTANVQGGTADFTYSWSNSATTSSITTPQLTTATEYSVTVTDANNCSASASVNVEIGDTPGITIADVTPICVGGNTMLQANVSNAGTGYTVEWSSTDTGAGLPADVTTDAITVTPTTAGAYTYTASLTATSCSDGQPFTSSEDVTLTVNALPDAAITNNTNETTITCSTTQISLTATGGIAYQWSNGGAIADNNITSADTYTVTVTDANGCSNTESIVITEDVAAPTVNIINETGTTLLTCTTTTINVEATGTGTSYLWSNEVTTATNAITTGGTYTVTATADNGCTSTAAIEITPNADAPSLSITNNTGQTELTCALISISVTATGSGTSYEWSNGAETAENTLTAPGTYIVTATAGNGCSASEQITITQDIAAPNITASATESAICQGESTTISAAGGESYTWSPETGLPSTVGASLTATPTTTTTYTVTGVGTNGCNGTADVIITVNLPTSSEFTETACDSYEWNNLTYTETGDFTQTFINANGCDSVVTLHLTINNSQTNTDEVSACDSYEWAGETYTASGTYVHTFTAVNGCDSVVTLHLTINTPTESNDTVTVCDSYEWNGTTYTETGNYQVTLPNANANGCDSIANLFLTINHAVTGIDRQEACESFTWIDGVTYTESTDSTAAPTFTLQNAEGCDSVVSLYLVVNHSTTNEVSAQMCSGVPYTYEGETFTEAGTYTVTLTNSHGCDSIVTLTITYANNCGGFVSGIVTDENSGEPISNARVTVGNQVTRTNAEGQFSIDVLRGRKALRVSATGYISYSNMVDIQSDTAFNISLNAPHIETDVDSLTVSSYPYLEQSDSITLSNTGSGTLVWSSITEYDNLALVEDSVIQQRRNTRSLWDSIQTFATRENAEQAIATDGFFIYTSSWMRPGEFNRYTPNGEYVETFYVENVGSIRNLSYDGTHFYGTEGTNIIFKLDLDNQTLVDSITTDIQEIRHCSFNKQDGSLLAGSWNSLYRIDIENGTSEQIRNDLANVYSSAFDNLSPGGPYLWLFSQTSQNNGPSAYIRQFNINTGEYTDRTHYLDDINLSSTSLAGGICASEYVCEGKFVLLADVQNPSGSNTIATYEIGRTNNVVRTGKKSGSIAPNNSENISVKASATETGDYSATIRYRAAVMGAYSRDIDVNIAAVAPECDAVQQISIVTDTFHTVTLDWQPVELGNYESVSYLVFNTASQFAIDTVSETTVTYDGLPVGEHCFCVMALSQAGYTCLSEASDTVCAEIEPIPCNVALAVEAANDGESIFLTWNKPVGVEYFRIHRDDNAFEEVLYDDNFIDTNVVPEITYCYTVIAYFEGGICDEIVGTACSRIVSGVCEESPVLQIEAVGYSVHLNWTGTSDSYTYKIFRNDVAIGMTTGTTYFDNVNPGYNYCYKVESLCEYGMFTYSNEECVFVEVISEDEGGQGSGGEGDAIEEWTADNLTVYPNPTYGQFFIEGSHIATVQIYNASGQIVVEFDNTESDRIMVNCDGWNPGMYHIRIISADGQVATRKISIFR